MYKINKFLVISFLLTLLLTLPVLAHASSAMATGLGNNYSVFTDVESYNANPAGLAERKQTWTLVTDISGTAWANCLEISDNYIDINKSLDTIANENLATGIDMNFNGRLYFKTLGAGLGLKSSGLFFSDFQEFSYILAEENTIDLTADSLDLISMDINDIGGQGAVYADTSISYAIPVTDKRLLKMSKDKNYNISKMNFGITGHYLYGGIFKVISNVEEFNVGSEDLDGDDSSDIYFTGQDEGKVLVRYSEEGTAQGYAVDLGMNIEFNNKYNLGLSILGLGHLEENNVLESGTSYEFIDPATNEDGDTVYQDLNTTEIEEENYNGKLTYNLPLTIQLGGSIDYKDKNIKVYGNYANINYDSLSENENRFSVAVEAKWLKSVPLRLGMSYSSLKNELEIPAGMGLHFQHYKMDLGISNITSLWDNNKSITVSFSNRIDF